MVDVPWGILFPRATVYTAWREPREGSYILSMINTLFQIHRADTYVILITFLCLLFIKSSICGNVRSILKFQTVDSV